MDREFSAEALLRGGGKGDISVSLLSWARVSFRRRRLRLLLGVVSDRSDTAFFMAGLSFYKEQKKSKKEAMKRWAPGEKKDNLANLWLNANC